MLRQRNQAVSNNRNIHDAAESIASGSRKAIINFRQLSRLAGSKQGSLELESADSEYAAAQYDFSQSYLDDIYISHLYAKNLARLWLAKAIVTKGTYAESARAANRDSLSRLELISATESSRAYSEGKDASVSLYNGNLVLNKVWDASMDKNSCSVCGSSDGETVGIDENFSLGSPGSVHPNCRCTYLISNAN